MQLNSQGYIIKTSKNTISKIIYQPELRHKFINKIQNIFSNRVIWGKLIKNELFKKILIYLGPEFTVDYINEAEDTILAISTFHLAKSYYIMKEEGYYYSGDEKKNAFHKTNNKECKINYTIKNFGWYIYYKFLVDKNSNNDKEKKMIINEMKICDPRKEIKTKLENRHYKTLCYVYDTMLEWNCWNNKQKEYIIEQKKNKTMNYKIGI